ncbi:hypothetical protein CCACVL1_14973 [Corchorus capsularis]|uniref:Uncharacterized protein n=1 Tax=Corchorus capsularis TaxID=210143 RepID=A0A1R3I4P9_COCAP|nr:hypothetical protein CCACVL1_14973 [Corchorus capsularis]
MSSGGQALEHMGPKTNQVGRQACDMGAQRQSGMPPSQHMGTDDMGLEANHVGAQATDMGAQGESGPAMRARQHAITRHFFLKLLQLFPDLATLLRPTPWWSDFGIKMEYSLLELKENLARIKEKASHIEMQRSKMEAMINFVRDQFIVLPEDIYKCMTMMKAQYAQFMSEESQLEAMLNFARQNYQSSLKESDANMTSKSVNIPVGKQHEAMQHPKVLQCSEALSPSLNIPKPIQEAEKEDEEDNIMALDEDDYSHETTYEDESMEIVPTKDVLVKSENNGVSHEYEDDSSSETRVEEEQNMEIIEATSPLECEYVEKVEEEVESQAMIEN